MPSGRERREHAGKVPQPGVPSGPRNTPKPKKARRIKPAPEVAGPYPGESSVPSIRRRSRKERAEARSRGETPLTPYAPKKGPGAKRARRYAAEDKRAAKRAAAAEKVAERVDRRIAQRTDKALDLLKDVKVTPDPQTAESQARLAGIKPPSKDLKRLYGPRAAKKVERAYIEHIASKEGIHADPIAELAISTAATAGLGAGAKALATAGEKGLATLAARGGAEEAASAGAKAAEGVVKARPRIAGAKARVEGAVERRVARAKAAPERIKTAPKRARRAASTSEGRRAAARGAGRSARRHPVRTGYGAAVVSPVPLPGELDRRARAFAKGEAAAAFGHPGEYLGTTGEAALGFLTGPLSIAAATVDSAKQGSLAPLGTEARGIAEGTAHMVGELASGDARRVERNALAESGAVPFIPVPHVLRRLKGTKAYEDARGTLRGKVEDRRGKTRAKRTAAEKAATEKGEFIPKRKARKVRQSVADTARPGENYALRRTGKLIERQRSRHHTARQVTRIEQEGSLAGKKESEAVAKPLRSSKGTDQSAQNDGEALRIFVKHGLPAEEASGMAYVKMLHDNWPKIKEGDVPPGVHLDRHSTKYIIDHPEIFRGKRGKQFFESVREFDRQSADVGTSPRNRYLAQVNNIINPIRAREGKPPILRPEEDITPEAKAVLPERDKQWTRSEALDYLKELRQVGNGDGRSAEAQAKAKALSEAMNGLMKPPEHGGAEHGVSTTQAVAWTPEMEREFVAKVQPEIERLGLREPAHYVADVMPSGLQGADVAPNFAAELPVRKVWPSEGKAAMSGNAISDFESTMFHSVEAPRARGAAVQGLNRIFDRASREVGGRRYLTRAEAEHAIATHEVPDGTIFVRTQALRSLLEGEHVASAEEFRRALMGEVEHGQRLASADQLAGEIEAAKAAGIKGDKFAPMDAVAIHELLGHLAGPGDVTVGMGHATNFATRAILNSPAFEISQFAQEGIPGAAALGQNIVHIPRAIAALEQVNKLPADMQAQIRAVVGSSVGVLGAPSLKALRSEGFMNPVRAAGRKQLWRHAWEIVNGDKLGRFDQARAGRFREVAALSKIEGDFKRAEKGFNLWRRGAANLFKNEAKAVEEMRGMNRAERLAYVAEHPRLGDRLMRDMNAMMGNWNSYTVFEKQIAPFTIFYPFQRYSVLWALYHFPLDHPVVATGLALAGAANAEELRRLAATKGATPDVLDYTKPVVNGTLLPAGQRFFSGLGALQTAVLEDKPTQALQGLSPALSIPIEALTGKNAYTGAPLGENGWLYALRQSASLSPFLRFLGVPKVGQDPSTAAEAFHALDPFRSQRSFYNPFIGQSGQSFAEEKQLSGGFEKKYGKGRELKSSLPPEVWEAAYNGDWEAAQRLRKLRIEAEQGSDVVRRYEQPFYSDQGGGDLGKTGSEILKFITGQLVLPAEDDTKSSGGFYPSQSAAGAPRKARRIESADSGFYPSQQSGGADGDSPEASSSGFYPSER